MRDVTPVRFFPSRVEGIDGVTEVVVWPTHLELLVRGDWLKLPFREFEPPSESRLVRAVRRAVGRAPRDVGERDWFRRDRFFRWYTSPPITTFLPTNDSEDWGKSLFPRIQFVLAAGGCFTFDLG